MYVIAGVTGHTGKVAGASLDDEAALARAMSGADGAYVLLPPDPGTADFFGSRSRMTDAIGVLPVAQREGILPSFLPADFTHAVVTTADIGRTAAQALLDGPRGRRVIELAGPADVTPADIAAVLTELLAHPMLTGFIDGTVAWEGKGDRVRRAIGVKEGLGAMIGSA
jgi:uncharacterized protein YbjT (DUF2867 family)